METTFDFKEQDVVLFVDQLIQDAIAKKVSDIHIEPYEEVCRIRFRYDGMLYEAGNIDITQATQVTMRLKIMAMLDITERRLPQDGRIQFRQQNNFATPIDIRINTCPIFFGEKIVLRILNYKQAPLNIDDLGMTKSQQALFQAALSKPQGLILVTGPTGSGKTITIYSALHFLNRIEKNIITIEDPVEIELKGINQVSINPKIGFSFANALQAFLRQDPDIIMVGEIRNQETAEIAVQAAQTGHLVLATLHTNSAVEAMDRLQCMGLSVELVTHSLLLIVAQRLLRKFCSHCKTVQQGCRNCHAGYSGRMGIFEVLSPSQTIIQLMIKKVPRQQIIDQLQKEGTMLLWQAGLEKVQTQQTSFAELIRCVGQP